MLTAACTLLVARTNSSSQAQTKSAYQESEIVINMRTSGVESCSCESQSCDIFVAETKTQPSPDWSSSAKHTLHLGVLPVFLHHRQETEWRQSGGSTTRRRRRTRWRMGNVNVNGCGWKYEFGKSVSFVKKNVSIFVSNIYLCVAVDKC